MSDQKTLEQMYADTAPAIGWESAPGDATGYVVRQAAGFVRAHWVKPSDKFHGMEQRISVAPLFGDAAGNWTKAPEGVPSHDCNSAVMRFARPVS